MCVIEREVYSGYIWEKESFIRNVCERRRVLKWIRGGERDRKRGRGDRET